MQFRFIKLAPALLLPGLVVLCGCAAMAPRPHHFEMHEVARGETLASIAGKYSADPDQIASLNGVSDPRALKTGTILQIPVDEPSIGSSRAALKSEPQNQRNGLRRVRAGTVRRYVGTLMWPVQAAHLSSRFGPRGGNFHEGVDLSAPEGSPIFAAHAGKVVYSGRGLRGYGRMVIVADGDIVTVYAHTASNRVEAGEKVKAGEEIGLVGESGDATGPHLHFEVRVRDENKRYVAVDPFEFYPRFPSRS